ncbi:hypothetical protein DF047_00785 [Burkholderia cenocepacia]|nr:hypothetical protein DF047_00785 [Burkholderia cenocepacia]
MSDAIASEQSRVEESVTAGIADKHCVLQTPVALKRLLDRPKAVAMPKAGHAIRSPIRPRWTRTGTKPVVR